MNKELYDELIKITDEEQQILDGISKVNRNLYIQNDTILENENKNLGMIDAQKLLESGKLIQIRPHTRFIHFPAHTHNYVEVVYMYSGSTHHVIDQKDIILNQGELLFLSKHATQEIYPAEKDDLAINFIILPEFFDMSLKMIGSSDSTLRSFIVESLIGNNEGPSYLHFKVADILPISNLVENLIWSILNKQENRRQINQITMGLLFLQLLSMTDRMEFTEENSKRDLLLSVLEYVDEKYKDGSLTELAELLHYDACWLSKEIKKISGRTFKDLIQDKRLSKAAYLLKETSMKVIDISMAVGYENVSYFHRLFMSHFGVSPRAYRIS